ncbi:MAG: arylsulfatase [Verrucomicrobia bacterium]|nr:arylsulfatase [Verrucomicrobiota bacterium]MCH8527842.1 arylsulfatase [Kiritimatiellia bacterium]
MTSATSTSSRRTDGKPNIVYILCDDLGYGDVRFMNPERCRIPTPHIDQLASESLCFTDAHSGSAVCTPTRYGFLTGRYAWRSRLQRGVVVENETPLIAEDLATLPGYLGSRGYRTACLGKWHLGLSFTDADGKVLNVRSDKSRENFHTAGVPVGTRVPDGPVTRGFEYFWGFYRSATMSSVIENDRVAEEVPLTEMLGELGRRACGYIAERAREDKPFFLYLPLNSPHGPIVPSESWQGRSEIGPYGDFIMETDDVVGRVLAALKANGLEENTLVIFTSDNGCSEPCAEAHVLEREHGHYPSAHLRGYKSDIWEGGHRVPFVARWPGRIPAGTTSDALICLTDLFRTCADLFKDPLPDDTAVDSESMLPLLLGETERGRNSVIHHSIKGRFSIRQGRWKLELCPGSGGWSRPKDPEALEQGLPSIQLYDMQADVSETVNLAEQQPEVVARLLAELSHSVEQGRSTPGAPQRNDVEIDLFKGAELPKTGTA